MSDLNPKDAVGSQKASIHVVPIPVMLEVGLALMEGACKYGSHNYRVIDIRASVYMDALMRHMAAWWEGEDIDADSGLNHVTKAIATLIILRDAMMNEHVTDDRPPRSNPGWLQRLNGLAQGIIERHPQAKEPFTQKNLPERMKK